MLKLRVSLAMFTVIIFLSCSAFSTIRIVYPGDIQPDQNEAAICRLVVKMLEANNYKKVGLNDSLSGLVFDRYLKSLDDNHSYLLQSDVDGFEKYKTLLDDDLQQGDLSHVFGMFNTFKKRNEERLRYAISRLDEKFDFTKKDIYVANRRKLSFIKTASEMDAVWDLRVKYDLLELQLAQPDIIKNKELLKKRYQNLLDQSGKTNSQDVFQLFMNAFTASIDPHVSYFNPFNAAQFNLGISRALEGIGATLTLENEYVTIKSLTPGGPAYKTKLINPGDRIIGLAQGKDGQFQDVVGWRLDKAIALIRGAKGTTVRLKLMSKASVSAAPQIISVVRDKIVMEDQSAKQQVLTYQSEGKTVKIGVISIPAFYIDNVAREAGDQNYKSTTRDVKLLLDTLKQKQVDGVMIDVRGNGGGSLVEAVSLTGLFIPSGPVVQVKDVSQRVQVNQDFDASVYYDGPLAVLVDRSSASASEIFSAAIQDYARGLILGAQTYGKGSVQTSVNLNKIGEKMAEQIGVVSGKQDQLGQLNITIGKFYRINGSSTQHKGVVPDLQLPSFIESSAFGEDNELSAMPWDTIGKSDYKPNGSLRDEINILTDLYKQRSNSNKAYIAYASLVKVFHDNQIPKPVSLNAQEFKKDRQMDTSKLLKIANQLRVAMGLPLLKETELRQDKLDFMRSEAGQILTDYISLQRKPQGT